MPCVIPISSEYLPTGCIPAYDSPAGVPAYSVDEDGDKILEHSGSRRFFCRTFELCEPTWDAVAERLRERAAATAEVAGYCGLVRMAVRGLTVLGPPATCHAHLAMFYMPDGGLRLRYDSRLPDTVDLLAYFPEADVGRMRAMAAVIRVHGC